MASGTNGSFTVKEGQPVFLEGQRAGSVNILAKGKVDVYISPFDEPECTDEDERIAKSYKLFSMNQNIFIGANDLFLSGKHTLSYRASEDTVIFSFFTGSLDEIETLFRQKNDYPVYILNSISTITEYSYAALQKLERLIGSLSVAADNLCLFFWILKDKHDFSYEPLHSAFRDGLFRLQELKERKVSLPYSFDAEFLECAHFEYDYSPSEEIDTLKMNYYNHVCSLNENLKKQFLNESFIIPQYHCTDCALILETILFKIKEALKVVEEYVGLIYSEEQPCIFGEFLKAGMQLEKSLYDSTDIIEVQKYIFNLIKNVAEMFETDYHHALPADIYGMGEKVADLKRNGPEDPASPDLFTIEEDISEELDNSVEKILAYSNIPKERYDLFMNALKAFRELKDKLSENDSARNLRRNLTSGFFEIYQAVLKRVTVENNQDKLFHLFLTYAYMDEKLLSPRHLSKLYRIGQRADSNEQYSVFSMKRWLQLIYNKERDPSVNSFSMDYFDVFREMKRQGEVTDQDKAKYDNDRDGRLSFEINNMFRPNQRLCNRHSVYFPILCDEVIVQDLDKALVSPKKVTEAVQKVLDVDFSAFHRELSYFNMKKGIQKEFIMQSVRPDIILMPTYGTNSLMWQEISGKIRNSPGRFIIPVFTAENLDNMVQKLIGEFRWELCRTMLGVSWNDITLKSLTSEYMDYLQFFKKNKDISEEVKEKIKKQIKKYRNISRDIFTSDYLIWLNYESNGLIRLNKFSRDILYRYCPFSLEIRKKLSSHPSFAASTTHFSHLRAKQVKELENRYAKYVREGVVLDEEMVETLNFYRDL